MGPAVRFAAAAEIYYGGLIRSSGSLRAFYKVVASVQTNIATDASGGGPPQVVRLNINGSSYELFDDGVSALSGTDTAITGGLRPGVSGHSSVTSDGDNFSAADLAAPKRVLRNAMTLGVGR